VANTLPTDEEDDFDTERETENFDDTTEMERFHYTRE
jgi:hypothetical protein